MNKGAVILRGTTLRFVMHDILKVNTWAYLTPGWYMLGAVGILSRFRSGVGRRVTVLFEDGRIENTWCSCVGGFLTIGRCAHSIAVLRFISELPSGRTWDVKPKHPDLNWMLLADEDAVGEEDESEDESEDEGDE